MESKFNTKKISESQYQLDISVPAKAFKASYDALLEQKAKESDVKGFRKGAVPKEFVETQNKEMLLITVFERLAPLYVSQAVTEEKLDIVAPPVYENLPKIDLDKDLSFTIKVTVMPPFKLGNLKKIKLEKKDISVSKEEIDGVITQLEANSDIKAEKGSDKWATEVGAKLAFKGIKDIAGLRDEIEKVLKLQKESTIKREMESDALKQGIELSKLEIPEPSIEFEAHEREHSFMHDLESKGMTLEQFMQTNNITIEKMREMWKKDAKDAIEADEFLMLYAKEKGLELTEEDLKEEVNKFKFSNPNVDDNTLNNPQWKEYIRRVGIKQKSFTAFMEEVNSYQK